MKEAILAGRYEPALIAVSIVIAICAAYMALDLAGRTAAARGKTRFIWLSGGACAMGTGIWAMHYIGMLAFHLPVPVYYHVPTVVVSWLAAVLASAVALFVVSQDRLRMSGLGWGSFVMGSGICAMHYIGMAAMRLPARSEYQWKIVAASVLIAILVAGAALFIAFRLRDRPEKDYYLRGGSAIIMGLAVCAMHYTGMAAVCFHHCAVPQNMNGTVSISSLGVIGITVVTFLVLLAALISVIVDRHFALQREMLSASQREYRLLVEQHLAAVCRTTLDGRVLHANSTSIKLLGYENLQQIIGVNMANHYWNIEDRISLIEQLRVHRALNNVEVCLKRADGSPVWVIYNLTLGGALDDGVPEIIATAMDISATKQAQRELLAAKEQAEAATIAKGQFLANMSHELRTPLNGMLGMTELALNSGISVEAREYLEISKVSANALLEIVNSVLDFSKIEARKLTLDQRKFDLLVLLHDALRIVSCSALGKNLHIATEISIDVPKRVIGDDVRLRQILLNLLGNAVKFTHEGAITLTVKAKTRGATAALQICVHDTGIGIASDKLNTIFEAFAQADNSSTRLYGGTGLGLTICKQLVEAMGGRLWVESELGKGSAFHFDVQVEVVPWAERIESLSPFPWQETCTRLEDATLSI